MSSIKITKIVNKALREDTAIAKAVGKKIFPLRAPLDTKYPFIILVREQIDTQRYSNKDMDQDTVTFMVAVVSNDYSESVDILDLVRKRFDRGLPDDGDVQYGSPNIVSVDEDIVEDAYIQTLTYSVDAY